MRPAWSAGCGGHVWLAHNAGCRVTPASGRVDMPALVGARLRARRLPGDAHRTRRLSGNARRAQARSYTRPSPCSTTLPRNLTKVLCRPPDRRHTSAAIARQAPAPIPGTRRSALARDRASPVTPLARKRAPTEHPRPDGSCPARPARQLNKTLRVHCTRSQRHCHYAAPSSALVADNPPLIRQPPLPAARRPHTPGLRDHGNRPAPSQRSLQQRPATIGPCASSCNTIRAATSRFATSS